MIRILFYFLFIILSVGCKQYVDDMIIEKFTKIDIEIQQKIEEKLKKRDSLLVAHSDLPKLMEVHLMTKAAETSIKNYRIGLEKYLRKNSSDNTIEKSNIKIQMEYSLGPSGAAYRLEDGLRSFVNKLNNLESDFNFGHVARHGNEIEKFEGTEAAKKDFAHLYFENTKSIAALAQLSELHSQVLNLELEAIEKLLNK